MLQILTPASTGNLTTLDTVKQDLAITDSSKDVFLNRLILEASSKITSYCQRATFGAESLRQVEYGPLSCIVLARDLDPVISIVTVDGVATTDYELDGSLVYRTSSTSRINWGAGRILIEYTAGYTLLGNLPPAVERACLDTIKHLYFNADRDAQLKGEKVLDIIDQTWSTAGQQQSGLPVGVTDALAPFMLEVVV